MGGDPGHSAWETPDWRKYKIDGIKELEWVQNSLAMKGLKDPWLRNEVWRYQNYGGKFHNLMMTFSRGVKYAVGLMAITIIIDQSFGISAKRKEIKYKHPNIDYHNHH